MVYFHFRSHRAIPLVFQVVIMDPSIRIDLSQNLPGKLRLERLAAGTGLFPVSCAGRVLNIEPFHAAGHYQGTLRERIYLYEGIRLFRGLSR